MFVLLKILTNFEPSAIVFLMLSLILIGLICEDIKNRR